MFFQSFFLKDTKTNKKGTYICRINSPEQFGGIRFSFVEPQALHRFGNQQIWVRFYTLGFQMPPEKVWCLR